MTTKDEYLKILVELGKAERDGTADNALISCGPFTAFSIVAALQLALRHPQLSSNMREIISNFANQLAMLFPEGSAVRELIKEGSDPHNDVGPEAEVKDFECPECGGTSWIMGEMMYSKAPAYQCDGCKEVFSADQIMAIIAGQASTKKRTGPDNG